MPTQTVIRIRDPLLLDITIYLSVVVMSLLGLNGLPNLRLQLIALGLCLTFGLLYRFFFRTGRYEQNPAAYFGAQGFVLALLFMLGTLGSGSTEAFNFLFLLLSINAALVLTSKAAATWITAYFGIVSAVILITSGTDGLFAIFFYSVTYVVCGFFGHILQQAELARDHNQRLLEELQATQQKLQELAVVEERNRLARDLHDSVKQQVFAISMQLSAARTALSESDKAYSSVAEAERLAQQAGAELTTLIHQLRPPSLERKSLTDAIKAHINEWTRQNKIESEIEIDSDVSVNLQTEQALFRALQEALANVARHSKASKVIVTLKPENGNIKLMVEDNGIGYDAERITKGIGLDSMKERLAAVNGELQVSSLQSHGTRITATVRRL